MLCLLVEIVGVSIEWIWKRGDQTSNEGYNLSKLSRFYHKSYFIEYKHLHPDNRQSNVAETNATQSLHVIPRHN